MLPCRCDVCAAFSLSKGRWFALGTKALPRLLPLLLLVLPLLLLPGAAGLRGKEEEESGGAYHHHNRSLRGGSSSNTATTAKAAGGLHGVLKSRNGTILMRATVVEPVRSDVRSTKTSSSSSGGGGGGGGGGGEPRLFVEDGASMVIETACGPMESNELIRLNDVDEDEVATGGTTLVAPFYGIRFAAPMTPEQRWRPPLPATCWGNGTTYQAKAFGDMCLNAYGAGAEDCLYLNVYVPIKGKAIVGGGGGASSTSTRQEKQTAAEAATTLLPVVVYLHGGGLMEGSGRDALWKVAGDWERPVVTVTVQYRLHLLGFLATAELSSEQGGSSGNYGIMDQQEALRWVQANIRSFGGDPERVTVVGQSSGGTSIFALLSSPASKGLLHGAISLSGSPNITIDMRAAERQNSGVINGTRCGAVAGGARVEDTLACMRNLTLKEVVTAIPSSWFTPGLWELPKGPPGQQYAGLPVVDGRLIPLPFLDALRARTVDVPFMVGAMQFETDCIADTDLTTMTTDQWKAYLEAHLDGWGQGVGADVYAMYEAEARVSPQKAFGSILSDTAMICGTLAVGRAAADGDAPPSITTTITATPGMDKDNSKDKNKKRSPVYVFVNSWNPAAPIRRGPTCLSHYAFHGWDHKNWMREYDEHHYIPEESDLEHSRFLREAIYQLTSTGRLDVETTGWRAFDDNPAWPRGYEVMLLEGKREGGQGGPRMMEDYKADRCQWFERKGIGQNTWWCD